MRLSALIAQDARYDVDLDVVDDDVVADVMVLLRVVRLTDSTDAIVIGSMDTTGGVVQYGMLRAANLEIERAMWNGTED